MQNGLERVEQFRSSIEDRWVVRGLFFTASLDLWADGGKGSRKRPSPCFSHGDFHDNLKVRESFVRARLHEAILFTGSRLGNFDGPAFQPADKSWKIAFDLRKNT